MAVYAIRDWDTHFEIAQSKRASSLIWVPLPNKHDGKSFRRLMRMRDGISLYGAWVLIVQVASKCSPRGILADSDGPLTSADIADKTGAPEKTIQRALDVCCDTAIGWIEKREWSINRNQPQSTAVDRDAPTAQHSTAQHKTGRQAVPPRFRGELADIGAVIAYGLSAGLPDDRTTRLRMIAYSARAIARGTRSPRGLFARMVGDLLAGDQTELPDDERAAAVEKLNAWERNGSH